MAIMDCNGTDPRRRYKYCRKPLKCIKVPDARQTMSQTTRVMATSETMTTAVILFYLKFSLSKIRVLADITFCTGSYF